MTPTIMSAYGPIRRFLEGLRNRLAPSSNAALPAIAAMEWPDN
jgi:hypothetical protein